MLQETECLKDASFSSMVNFQNIFLPARGEQPPCACHSRGLSDPAARRNPSFLLLQVFVTLVKIRKSWVLMRWLEMCKWDSSIWRTLQAAHPKPTSPSRSNNSNSRSLFWKNRNYLWIWCWLWLHLVQQTVRGSPVQEQGDIRVYLVSGCHAVLSIVMINTMTQATWRGKSLF